MSAGPQRRPARGGACGGDSFARPFQAETSPESAKGGGFSGLPGLRSGVSTGRKPAPVLKFRTSGLPGLIFEV